MILPNKHVSLNKSLLGAGAELLTLIEQPDSVSGLWQRAFQRTEIGSYWRFVLVLDFLFLIGLIDLSEGLIYRRTIE
jgi:hypothetical protein